MLQLKPIDPLAVILEYHPHRIGPETEELVRSSEEDTYAHEIPFYPGNATRKKRTISGENPMRQNDNFNVEAIKGVF